MAQQNSIDAKSKKGRYSGSLAGHQAYRGQPVAMENENAPPEMAMNLRRIPIDRTNVPQMQQREDIPAAPPDQNPVNRKPHRPPISEQATVAPPESDRADRGPYRPAIMDMQSRVRMEDVEPVGASATGNNIREILKSKIEQANRQKIKQ